MNRIIFPLKQIWWAISFKRIWWTVSHRYDKWKSRAKPARRRSHWVKIGETIETKQPLD